MATELGGIDLRVTPDKEAWSAAHKEGGKQSGKALLGEVKDKLFRGIGESLKKTLGGTGGSVASGALGGIVSGKGLRGAALGGAGGAALAGAGPIAIAILVATAALAAMVKLVKKLVSTLASWLALAQSELQRLAFTNPALAMGAAQGRVGQFLRDFQRGQFLAPLLSQIHHRRENVRNTLAPLKNVFASLRFGAVTGILAIMEKIAPAIIGMTQVALTMFGFFNRIFANLLRVFAFITDLIPLLGGVAEKIGNMADGIDIANRGIEDMLQQLKEALIQRSVEDLNRILTKDLELLTDGKWRFPTPAPLGPSGPTVPHAGFIP